MSTNDWQLCAFADEAGRSVTEQIAALQRNNISMLELRGVGGSGVDTLDERQAAELSRQLEDAGIAVWSIGSPVGKGDIHDDFAAQEEQFRRVLETAVITKARCIRLFSFYGTGGEAVYEDEVLLRLSRFAQLAQGSGVTLCHENEKDIYGDTAERCARLHKLLPQIRAVYDPANFIAIGEQPYSAWQKLAESVFYIHIKDATEGGKIVPAGQGEADLLRILPEYYQRGGRVLTLEPHLYSFDGLERLERDKKSSVGGDYASASEAFDAAAAALRGVLEQL